MTTEDDNTTGPPEPPKPSSDGEPIDSETATEYVRILALRKWAQTVISAQGVRATEISRLIAQTKRFREVDFRAIRATKAERAAIDMVQWLGMVFLHGRELDPVTTEIIERMAAAQHPDDRDRKISLGVELVAEYANAYLAQPRPGAWTPEQERANSLAVTLWSQVDPGFGVLAPDTWTRRTSDGAATPEELRRLDRVAELLALYEPGRGRRAGADQPDKLSAVGIFAELHTLAGWPLGGKLNANAVGEAVRRWNKKHPTSSVE